MFGYVRTAVGDDAARAARQGGVLLPRPPRRLPQPLRPPRRAGGHGRRRGARPRRRARRALAAYEALDVDRRPRPRQRHARGDDRARRGRGAVRRGASPARSSARSPSPSRWPPRRSAAPRPPLAARGPLVHRRQGRVVILHGVNMVYKVGSYRPADTGFGADDARFLRRNGFNTIRLGSSTRASSRARPAPTASPRYATPYLRSIARTERLLAKRGIFTLLDFHQDLYNERFQGEGWPDWQTIDDGVPVRAPAGFPGQLHRQRRRSAAPSTTSGRTTAVEGRRPPGRLRRRLAPGRRRFGDKPYVLGYDLLNEPWPGSAFGRRAAPARPAARRSTRPRCTVHRPGHRARSARSTPRRSSSTSRS